MDNATASDTPQQAPQCRYSCDSCSCGIPSYEGRYNCQDCHNFDYCETCFVDATLIHPGHSFTKIDPAEPRPKHEPQTEDDRSSTAETEQFCRSCATVTQALPCVHLSLSDERYPGEPKGNISLLWRLRMSSLIEATQRGCSFCCFILYTFFRPSNGEMYLYNEETPWYARPRENDDERKALVEHCMGTLTRLKRDHFVFGVYPICSRKGAKPPDYDKIEIALSNETTKIQTMEEIRSAKVFHSAGVITAEWHVYASKDDPASEHITTQPPNPAPASARGIQQIKEWLRNCDDHHGAACRPPGSDILPSRLIDVSGGDTLKLHETRAGEQIRYVTLSYCWGGPQTFQTEASTIASRIKGFSIFDLPRTLQDAVRVTQALDLRYLWVDALCITQDSQDDKFHQVSRMTDIYKNSYLTISAARADSAGSGFLQDRSDPATNLWKSLVPLRYALPNKSATTIQEAATLPRRTPTGTVYILSESAALTASTLDPVSSRAWCLQEQVLSVRLLSFGRWPTWRCSHLAASDGGYYTQDGQVMTDRGAQVRRRLTDALAISGGGEIPIALDDHFRTAQLLASWRALLQDYTRRKLTFASDKLPAIAGVARQLARLTGMEYRAGLWAGNMLQDMMWYAQTREWLVRASPWRAPSWSWASVDTPVLCNAVTADATPLARVLKCMVVPVEGKSGFEMVQAGMVEIRGPFAELDREGTIKLLRRQDYSPPPPVSKKVQDWYAVLLEHSKTQPSTWVALDEAIKSLPDKMFGLMMFSRDWRRDMWDKDNPEVNETCYFGLLLKEVEDGRFERIGAFWNDTSEMLDQTVQPWEERTVELV
ncbi:Heterokaryon incompatibility protein 6, OR allele [Madurella mycetomatis]|uniref:Heterokaryon incompatibility protein 6, OR allele n=1 Tax=Madurella mycetomatis TaxID=100816 RepID=A0A175W5E1_9PEZI|nr:Heterokaryon incompatibility protein 6, OR allele [Madurella mycetomatis]KXX82699.1 Heterokaryon incompatibility protein 6, OR allele [Madurella mycetomatis]